MISINSPTEGHDFDIEVLIITALLEHIFFPAPITEERQMKRKSALTIWQSKGMHTFNANLEWQ